MKRDDFEDANFSIHAVKRTKQRSRMHNVNILISFADRVIPVKNGCVALSISKSKLQSLVKEGHCNAQIVDKIKNMAAIVANDNDNLEVVTVAHTKKDIRGRHYRKNIKIRYRGLPRKQYSRKQN